MALARVYQPDNYSIAMCGTTLLKIARKIGPGQSIAKQYQLIGA